MIDDLKALAIFAETATRGSFKAAATHYDLSPSVVSHHVSSLERKLGVALLFRTTRSLRLTDQGKVLYQYAQEMLSTAEAGFNLLMEQGELIGNVSVSIPLLLSRSSIVSKLADFSRQHPKVQLDLQATDGRVDLLKDNVDVAIRLGDLPDSSLKAKPLGEIQRKLVCTRDLFDQFGPLNSLEQLKSLPWIGLKMLKNSRVLRNGEQKIAIHYDPQIQVNTVDLLTEMCLNGLGIATPPDFLVTSRIESGDLVELFPDWQVEPIKVTAVWPYSDVGNPTVRALIDFISQDELI